MTSPLRKVIIQKKVVKYFVLCAQYKIASIKPLYHVGNVFTLSSVHRKFKMDKHSNSRILSLISWTPGGNMGSDVRTGPADGNSQSKPMMEHSENYECVACTVGVNTHHYAGSLCSGSVPW